ncbi:YARHG domain-containing protein [Lacrimispora algidixylanolytica]|uniref:YARHG domain-containing protein n=1 Tax=Lacrimispora algidixylanolytica TaxID=94868 RepID=A0A419T2G1_9FIRM|nr:YARHG domain-containing protein [Lacrimispora algidixylanolytica]RKD31740.1 hypothetical protein BET01_19660 [Lacrimispora algidixylanolytica]
MKSKTKIIIVCSCLILFGCTKSISHKSVDIETTQTIKTEAEKEIEKENYESYSGLWTVNGLSHDAVISNGGAEFSFQVKDTNNLNGYFFTQQATSQRISEIDTITGKIINGELNFRFDDDVWGGSGLLHITFRSDAIRIEVQDYKMNDTNMSGYGISGSYQLKRSEKNEAKDSENKVLEGPTSEEELLDAVHEKYYSQGTDIEMVNAIEEGKQYREKCSFYPEVAEYLETVREVTDISSLVEPLYYTDMKIYQVQDFDQVPPLIIHLAKNEIYARHGYIFKNEDLDNYFKGQIWYEPSISPEEFKDSLFNKIEQSNLKLLSGLDAYK